MSTFPQGTQFVRGDDLEVWLRWPNPEGDPSTQRLDEWLLDNCVAGVDAQILETASGAIASVVLVGPSNYSTQSPVAGRRFRLVRHEDVSTVSGTGVVLHGIQYPDGAVAGRWCVPGLPASNVTWDRIEDVEQLHGHHGKTEVEWID